MMDFFTGDLVSWFSENYWAVGGLFFVIGAVLAYLFSSKPKKKTQQPIEDEKIIAFIESYGGMENIKVVELDGRRLKLQLNQIDLLDLERFKSLGATGIFITGNQVKMVLPYDMNKLVDYIKFHQMEEKK